MSANELWGEVVPINFFVIGKAEPAGSKKAVSIPGRSFTQVVDANKNAGKWKKTVKGVAEYEMKKEEHRIIQAPCAVRMKFTMRRPQGHWTLSGELTAEGRRNMLPGKKPDALKLARGVEDAMAGVVYIDDALIVDEYLHKRYQDTPTEVCGVEVWVWAIRLA